MATNLPDPVFINSDPDEIVAFMKSFYETETGLTLSPAQLETLMINVWGYTLALHKSGINEACKLNLVAFAFGVILDYLAQLVGVTRLGASVSLCDIEFTLVTGHLAVVIPQGTRVSSVDGKAVFRTTVATPVGLGIDTVTIACECDTPGTQGNGYAPGTIITILDPQAYLQDASNQTITLGGADVETDEQLRVRIYLAPASFGTAGSKDGYKFWARSANTLIIDVEVDSSAPLVIDIYPLIAAPGGTPQPILDQVYAACSADKRRPIGDLVQPASPIAVNYDIDVDVVLYDTADITTTLAELQTLAETFRDVRRAKLGRDFTRDQLKGMLVIPNKVYSIVVTQPAADSVLTLQEYAECNSITINITGINAG